jgi:hypothetical protein
VTDEGGSEPEEREPSFVAPLPGPEAHDPAEPRRPPGMLAIASGGLDLNVAASGQIRSVAVYIGLLTIAALGPLVAIALTLGRREGGFEWMQPIVGGRWPHDLVVTNGEAWLMTIALLTGVSCAFALSVDSQLLSVILVASRALGRPFELRAALELARMRFFRLLRATILTGILLILPRGIAEGIVTPSVVGGQSRFLLQTAIGIVLSIPFAYVSAWIVLGAVGARTSIGRSWRLARARLRLAILIAIFNVAFQTLAGIAIGVGVGVLVRLGTVFDLGDATGYGQLVLLGAIVSLAVMSIGSLSLTIAALTAGPQVVAFLGLTGISNGLDVNVDPGNPFRTPRVEPLVSRPMAVALVIGAVAGGLAVLQLL